MHKVACAQQVEQEAVEARKYCLLNEMRVENEKQLMTPNSFDMQIENARYSTNLKAQQLAGKTCLRKIGETVRS